MNMRPLAKNIRSFLLALVLGVSVWVSAVSAADPNEVRTYPRAIPIEVVGKDPSLVLTNANEIPQTMEISLRAPHSVWEMLTAREDTVRAVLDLTGLSTGEHTVKIQVTVAIRPYQIVLEDPATVTVVLESLAAKTFPLSLSLGGQPAAGYQVGEATMETTKVAVSGPESIVQRATRVRVFVSLDGARESINESLPIQILDAQNKPLKGLTLNPETVRVNVPISPQAGYRDVAVKVVVQGQVAAGYRLENIRVFPPVITVSSSDPQLVNQLPGVVETQPLNLQDRKEDVTTRLSLNLPANITIVGAQTVQVQVSITPIQTSLTLLNQPLNVNGLSEGLSAQVLPQTVDVIVSGPLPVLDALTSKNVTVSVDATNLQPGTYQLTPQVKVSVENVLVESILPGTVEVAITIPITPTPTPGP
jgi:YbbR domain-containing protein